MICNHGERTPRRHRKPDKRAGLIWADWATTDGAQHYDYALDTLGRKRQEGFRGMLLESEIAGLERRRAAGDGDGD